MRILLCIILFAVLLEGSTDRIAIQLHPTERFYEHLDILLEGMDGVEQFKSDLASALKVLEGGWDAPLKSHGNSGRDFSYPINKDFVLIFRRETDRTAEGKPLLVHLYLKTIEHAKT